MKEITAKEAFQKLSALCARSEHCRYDMIEKMRQWGVPEEEQAAVVERLVDERYVDEERYVRAFIHDKIEYSHWGRRKVEQALWQKRIDGDLVRQLLDEVDDEAYIAILRPMLKQKQRSITGRNDYERSLKLIKWAMGRGFTMDVIRQCIEVGDEDEFSD